MSLSDRWLTSLDELRSLGRYRSLVAPSGVDFSSNDYLGYGKKHWSDGPLSRSGAASRLLRGHHELWDRLESILADWHGCERVLMMNSGYVANEGLLATAIAPEDWVASDQLNHASIIDGLKLSRAERFVYRHLDVNHLEEGLMAAHAKRTGSRQLFVVTESLFGMDGDVAPLADIVELCVRYDAHLIVDEAHATGCIGEQGQGFVDSMGLRANVLATVHTGGKALGVPGAYIAGSSLLREILVNQCRHLIFTTAMPPVFAHWWSQAVECAQRDAAGRAKLQANANRFREALSAKKIITLPGRYLLPIRLGDDSKALAVARTLAEKGYDIRAIRPPTVPVGTARLRISIHADHTAEEIEKATSALAEVLGVVLPRNKDFPGN